MPFLAAESGETLTSLRLCPFDLLHVIALERHADEAPFRNRDQRLLDMFHQETIQRLGTKLATFDMPSIMDLAPRLCEVLARLLHGDSEKQIAARLNRSPYTVHEHVKRLHRHFDVTNLGELLARCGDLRHVLDGQSWKDDGRDGGELSAAVGRNQT